MYKTFTVENSTAYVLNHFMNKVQRVVYKTFIYLTNMKDSTRREHGKEKIYSDYKKKIIAGLN